MQASAYLGDLGGLSAHRTLILVDLRGTGASSVPGDPTSYRCDRLVDDVEALRTHLMEDRVDVPGHSAGCSLAVLYAGRYPDRIRRLALITPSPQAVGLEISDSGRRDVAELRRGEPWFAAALAAFERIWSDDATAADWAAIKPFTRGRWDAANQAHAAQEATQKNGRGGRLLLGRCPQCRSNKIRPCTPEGASPSGRRRVRRRASPKCAAGYADLFRQHELTVQLGAGHYPWLDDPKSFVATVTSSLAAA